MFVIDDPVLALITRFVIGASELRIADEPFLKQQFETLKQHLQRYSEEEQESRAIEWIAAHAEQYRIQWQKRVVSNQANQTRCVDCPMNVMGEELYCPVHFQWLELLKRYCDDELTSGKYVEAALQMLREHKEQLAIRKQREAEGLEQLKNFHDARNRPL